MDLVYPNETRLFRIALTLAIVAWILIIFGTIGIALIYIGAIAVFMIFAQSGFITHLKGNGIKITAEQYPDLFQQLQACCIKVDQKEVPDAYLLRTDFFNALATRFLRRHYIVLFTDVVDALRDKPGAINFYIGHEVGHIQRNHIRWGWILAPVLWLPVLGNAYRRAEEYTCDRYGNACCDAEEDAVAAMSAIVAGDTRWHDMNLSAYLKQVDTTGGFFMSLNEFISEYPWLCKRMAWVVALRSGTSPAFPRRSFLAGLLSILVPSVPGGAVSVIMLVAIVGVMAAVALPAYQNYIETAELANLPPETVEAPADYWQFATPENLSNVLTEVEPIREQVATNYEQNKVFVTDLTELGWEGSFVSSEHGGMPIAVYDGGIIAATIGTADGEDSYFVIEPAVSESGEIQWYCYGQNVPDAYLPETCRSEDSEQ